jgi:hypothetical protein
MSFIDFEDLDLVLGSTVTPNPDFHELELSLNDSSYHPSLPKQTRLLHVLHPFDATTTGAPYDRIPSPCRTRSRALSAPQRLTQPVTSRPYLMPLTSMGFVRTLRRPIQRLVQHAASRLPTQEVSS